MAPHVYEVTARKVHATTENPSTLARWTRGASPIGRGEDPVMFGTIRRTRRKQTRLPRLSVVLGVALVSTACSGGESLSDETAHTKTAPVLASDVPVGTCFQYTVYRRLDGTHYAPGWPGSAPIVGTNGRDTLSGGASRDLILGLGENDTIYGNGGHDYLCGDGASIGGHDTIYGGDGGDHIDGGWGVDEINGNAGDDTIRGGSQDDVIHGGQGNDEINGNEDRDTIYGDKGDDIIHGGSGHDNLLGGPGADRLYGDKGWDWLFGYSETAGDPDHDVCDGGPTEDPGDTDGARNCETVVRIENL